MTIQVYDGINGGLLTKSYQNQGEGHSTDSKMLRVFDKIWQSLYGQTVNATIAEAIEDIREATACQPMTGRVINVAGDKIVSLGRDNGISEKMNYTFIKLKRLSITVAVNTYSTRYILENL